MRWALRLPLILTSICCKSFSLAWKYKKLTVETVYSSVCVPQDLLQMFCQILNINAALKQAKLFCHLISWTKKHFFKWDRKSVTRFIWAVLLTSRYRGGAETVKFWWSQTANCYEILWINHSNNSSGSNSKHSSVSALQMWGFAASLCSLSVQSENLWVLNRESTEVDTSSFKK